MKTIKNIFPFIIFSITLLCFSDSAFASTHYLNTVGNSIHTTILPWQGSITSAARILFFALAGIEVAVFALQHVLQKRGHEDLFSGFIKKTITLGFFLMLINNGTIWATDIVNAFQDAPVHIFGASASSVTPYGIADEALKAFLGVAFAPFAALGHDVKAVESNISHLNVAGMFTSAIKTLEASNPLAILIEGLECLIIGLLVGISILYMALEFLMVQIESYLVIALGVLALAGGGLRWTTKYVNAYFDYALNVGFRLLIISAIAFLDVYSIIPHIKTILENNPNPLQGGFEVLILGALIALLPKKASSIANSILNGSSTFSGGELAKEGAMIGAGTAAAVALPAAGLAAGAGVGAAAGAEAIGSAGAGGLSAAGEGAGVAGSLGASSGASGAGAGAGASGSGVGASSEAASGASSSSGSEGGVKLPAEYYTSGSSGSSGSSGTSTSDTSTSGDSTSSSSTSGDSGQTSSQNNDAKTNTSYYTNSNGGGNGGGSKTDNGGNDSSGSSKSIPQKIIKGTVDHFSTGIKDHATKELDEGVKSSKLDFGHMRDFD